MYRYENIYLNEREKYNVCKWEEVGRLVRQPRVIQATMTSKPTPSYPAQPVYPP